MKHSNHCEEPNKEIHIHRMSFHHYHTHVLFDVLQTFENKIKFILQSKQPQILHKKNSIMIINFIFFWVQNFATSSNLFFKNRQFKFLFNCHWIQLCIIILKTMTLQIYMVHIDSLLFFKNLPCQIKFDYILISID